MYVIVDPVHFFVTSVEHHYSFLPFESNTQEQKKETFLSEQEKEQVETD